MAEPEGDLQAVDVEHGMRPLLTDSFVSTYGTDSVFTFAVADLFTSRLAFMLEQAGRIGADDPVAYGGSVEAQEQLQDLLRGLGETSQREASEVLYREAFRDGVPGAFEGLVDGSLGAGHFGRWLARLESGNPDPLSSDELDEAEAPG